LCSFSVNESTLIHPNEREVRDCEARPAVSAGELTRLVISPGWGKGDGREKNRALRRCL
jgi:hypothetical protein